MPQPAYAAQARLVVLSKADREKGRQRRRGDRETRRREIAASTINVPFLAFDELDQVR
jgi:hypothetical protein